MARTENGHCSTCQAYNDAGECQQAQNFSSKIGETLAKNEKYLKINSLFPTISQNTTIITDTDWNKIKSILNYIQDYGEEGTRNPTNNELNATAATDGNEIELSLYNNILTALDKTNLNTNTVYKITKSRMDKLKTYIQEYKIDTDRCNTCNTAANCPTCQSQGGGESYCDDPCYCKPSCGNDWPGYECEENCGRNV